MRLALQINTMLSESRGGHVELMIDFLCLDFALPCSAVAVTSAPPCSVDIKEQSQEPHRGHFRQVSRELLFGSYCGFGDRIKNLGS